MEFFDLVVNRSIFAQNCGKQMNTGQQPYRLPFCVYGFSHDLALKKKLFCPQSLRTAFRTAWILPRAKKVSTGHFFTHPSGEPRSSNPIYPTKNTLHKVEGVFYGVDNGIRTHDLQSHNLTR